MQTVPFLTDIDPQAAVKGSRDPLGLQTIWSRLGRHVVGNLTTVTRNVRDFTTLLLGYYFAERVAGHGGADGDLNVFLRWEQMAGHARFRVNDDGKLRGIDRVRKAKSDGGPIHIGVDSRGQILSKQKTYGLWGLYTAAARSSGFVEGDPTRVTTAARDLIETSYLPAFAAGGLRNADAVVSRLSRPSTEIDTWGKDAAFLRTIGEVLKPKLGKREREIFREHLMFGRAPDKTDGRQEAVATATEESLDKGAQDWSPAHVSHLAKRCHELGEPGEAAADRLERIRVAEQLLAPAASLFELLIASDGQAVSQVASAIRTQWGKSVPTIDLEPIQALEPELRDSTGSAESGNRWVRLAGALSEGDYSSALNLLADQNASVMRARAGAGPWVILSSGTVDIKYRDESPEALPGRKALPDLWKHSYFLDALESIASELSS